MEDEKVELAYVCGDEKVSLVLKSSKDGKIESNFSQMGLEEERENNEGFARIIVKLLKRKKPNSIWAFLTAQICEVDEAHKGEFVSIIISKEKTVLFQEGNWPAILAGKMPLKED